MVDLHRPVRKWEIYFANLNPNQGSEQAGRRPVLVLSRDEVNAALTICTVAPFTSYKPGKKIHPSQLFIDKNITHLSKDSVLLIHQIRTISKSRMDEKMAGLITNPSTKMEINEKLMEYFKL